MRVSCTIEARLGSRRLPGKVFYHLAGKPMIWYPIAAAQGASSIDRVILCTTENPEDDVLADYCQQVGISCFRGSESNVAGRVRAALDGSCDANVFLTGDNPLVTSDLITDAINQFRSSGADYLCTTHMKYCSWWDAPPSLPTGLSVQIAKTEFFREKEQQTPDGAAIREHSTMVMYDAPDPARRFAAYAVSPELQHLLAASGTRRFTVDTADDFRAADRLLQADPFPSLASVLSRR